MTHINFVLMATDDFAHWLALCHESIVSFHPEARIWLFDLSEMPSPIMTELAARDANVTVIRHPKSAWRWPAWIDGADLEFFWPNCTVKDRVKMGVRSLRRRFFGQHRDGWIYGEKEFVAKRRRFVRIVAQKPHVLKAVAARTEGTLVFIDVDAILLSRLDGVLPPGAVAGVTVDRPDGVVIAKDPGCGSGCEVYPYLGLNTGVVLVAAGGAATPLLDAWIDEMEHVKHVCIEQTALANLLYRHCPDVFSDDEHDIVPTLDGKRLPVRVLPCARFNMFRVRPDTGALADDVLIAHFVGGLKHAEHWRAVERLARAEIARRHVTAVADPNNPKE